MSRGASIPVTDPNRTSRRTHLHIGGDTHEASDISSAGLGADADPNLRTESKHRGYDLVPDRRIRAQDTDKAFSYASPNIQSLFGTPGAFGIMVQNPAELEYADQITNGSYTLQRLRIQDQSGEDHWFAYEMIVINGIWRANGVYRIEPIGLSA
ncbi:DUF4864 domain-containing protein [Aliiroseovarius sp. PrR006]|nr:DUF4864 domain-containing protein [Aliiroseovarius sp. PrR006]